MYNPKKEKIYTERQVGELILYEKWNSSCVSLDIRIWNWEEKKEVFKDIMKVFHNQRIIWKYQNDDSHYKFVSIVHIFYYKKKKRKRIPRTSLKLKNNFKLLNHLEMYINFF